MILGWLIKHSALYQLLEQRLADEREAHQQTRLERDDYRDRWMKQVEYSAVVDAGRPRFSYTEKKDPKAPQTSIKTYGAQMAELAQTEQQRFRQFLVDHPEERQKLESADPAVLDYLKAS